ncbi:MAG: hypothetical protein ACI915_005608 [Gammaproteobacteria bacterium]|jgi:hypothetical protein
MIARRTIASIGFGIIVLAVMCDAAVADIGRLFFTPQERAAFDKMRQTQAAGPAEKPPEIPADMVIEGFATEPEPLKPTITIDGFVRRSNGRTTLWVNRENSYDGNLSASQIEAHTTHMHGSKIHLTPLGEDLRVRLKSGQSYDPNTMTVTDVYETARNSDDMVER